MRVFSGGIATETNTFAPIPTGMASFRDRGYYPAGTHSDQTLPMPLDLLDDAGSERFTSFAAWVGALKAKPSAVNVAALVGHSTLRATTMESLDRVANGEEIDENDVQRILAFDDTMIGSDGIPVGEKPHPRPWGTFPRVLGHSSRDVHLFPLETAVWKMTGLTAKNVGLEGRGRVAQGHHADLVLFDAARIRDAATYDEPTKAAEGIRAVVVNGTLAWEEGRSSASRRHCPCAFSKAVRAGGFLFVSGVLAMDAKANIVEGDVQVQTRVVLERIAATLAECGAAMEQVVKATVWLADLADFAAFNVEYARQFGAGLPARSCVQAVLYKGAGRDRSAGVRGRWLARIAGIGERRAALIRDRPG